MKNLHENYLMILRFMNPNEGIKSWVINDEDQIGHYHESWDSLMPVVRQCQEKQIFGSNHIISDLNALLQTVEIDQVYSKAVEFIKYYNEETLYATS